MIPEEMTVTLDLPEDLRITGPAILWLIYLVPGIHA